VTSSRRSARCSSPRTCAWTASSGPGHVSTWSGRGPSSSFPRPIRAPGRRLRLRARSTSCRGSSWSCASSARGAARSRTSTTGSSRTRATSGRWRSSPRSSSCGPTSSGAARLHLPSALRLSGAYADFDAERRWSVPTRGVADPKAVSAARC
jgi:hypothetical protein